MPKLVCQDCGEVLEEDLSQSEAEEAKERIEAEDQTSDHNHDSLDGSDDSGSGLSDRSDAEQIEDDVEDKFDGKLDDMGEDEKAEEAQNDIDDYEDAASEEDLNLQVEVGAWQRDWGEDRWEEQKRKASQTEQVFRDKLRQKQKNETHYQQRSGRFDSNRMIAADRGSPRVFKREDEGDDLEYEAYFVLDRSTSMSYRDVVAAENAVAHLAIALEDAGVKSEVLDFYGDHPRVIKTKSQEIGDEKKNLMRGGYESDGGTPLGPIMQLLNGRLEGTFGDPFVVVVTDGKPNNVDPYKEALMEMDAPVLGVNIGSAGRLSDELKARLYDEYVDVLKREKLDEKLKELARGVMF
jgi:Mg-chelatase subunit ChlD